MKARMPFAVLVVLLAFSLVPVSPTSILDRQFGAQSTYAFSEGGPRDEEGGHKWIIHKALEYLREKEDGFAPGYRLQLYQPWLYYGAWFADPTVLGCGVEILWEVYEVDDNCDAIHLSWPETRIHAKSYRSE